jgi:hypothetical protein
MPRSVVFPEPDGPMIATSSPSATTKLTPRSASTETSLVLWIFRTSSSTMTFAAGDISAPSSNAAELLGREHQARGRTRPQPRLEALVRTRVDSGAA